MSKFLEHLERFKKALEDKALAEGDAFPFDTLTVQQLPNVMPMAACSYLVVVYYTTKDVEHYIVDENPDGMSMIRFIRGC